jgi:hypothetical protein
MAVATAQVSIPAYVHAFLSIPIAANTKIYGGAAVCINASGYLVNAADTSGLIFIGFANESLNAFDNTVSGNANGSFNVPVTDLTIGQGLYTINAANPAQSWVGTHAFWLDNTSVGQAGSSTNKIIAGTIVGLGATGASGSVIVDVRNRSALANS